MGNGSFFFLPNKLLLENSTSAGQTFGNADPMFLMYTLINTGVKAVIALKFTCDQKKNPLLMLNFLSWQDF